MLGRTRAPEIAILPDQGKLVFEILQSISRVLDRVLLSFELGLQALDFATKSELDFMPVGAFSLPRSGGLADEVGASRMVEVTIRPLYALSAPYTHYPPPRRPAAPRGRRQCRRLPRSPPERDRAVVA